MKIILTERQYKILESQQDDDLVAMKALHTIWQDEIDSTGEIDFDPKIVDYIGYRPKGGPKVHEMYRDFLGGWNKMVEKSYELLTLMIMILVVGTILDLKYKDIVIMKKIIQHTLIAQLKVMEKSLGLVEMVKYIY